MLSLAWCWQKPAEVFAIGDCAVSGKPPTAQVAYQQGPASVRLFIRCADVRLYLPITITSYYYYYTIYALSMHYLCTIYALSILPYITYTIHTSRFHNASLHLHPT